MNRAGSVADCLRRAHRLDPVAPDRCGSSKPEGSGAISNALIRIGERSGGRGRLLALLRLLPRPALSRAGLEPGHPAPPAGRRVVGSGAVRFSGWREGMVLLERIRTLDLSLTKGVLYL